MPTNATPNSKPHRWAVTLTATSSYPEMTRYSAVYAAGSAHVAIGQAIKMALAKRKATGMGRKHLVKLLIEALRLSKADV